MKRVLYILAVFFFASFGTAQAQSSHIRVGPMFTAGAAVNAGDVAEGWKTSPRVAWTFGALADFSINPVVSFDLGLSYASRSINFHNEKNEDVNRNDFTLGYFLVQPE